jgi:hypothetical protein
LHKDIVKFLSFLPVANIPWVCYNLNGSGDLPAPFAAGKLRMYFVIGAGVADD